MIRTLGALALLVALCGPAAAWETCNSTRHPRCGVTVDSAVRYADARACYERGRCERVVVRPDGRGGLWIGPRR